MLKKFHHACVVCSDYEVTKEFYVNTLGFTVFRETFSSNWNGQKLELYFKGQYILEVFVTKDAKNQESRNKEKSMGFNHLSFLVDDVKEVINNLRSKKINTSEVKQDKNTGKEYAFFYDPDGTKFEIYED